MSSMKIITKLHDNTYSKSPTEKKKKSHCSNLIMCIHLKVQSFENILLRLWLLKLQYLYLFMVYIEFFCDLHLLPSNPNFFLTFLAHLPQLGSSGLQCSSPNHRFVYSCRQVPLVKEKQLKLCEIFYSHEIIPLRQPTYLFLPTN